MDKSFLASFSRSFSSWDLRGLAMTNDMFKVEPKSILIAFQRYPKEAAIIGRLLAGYGDLEYELHLSLGAALGSDEAALRAMFRVRGEKQRIQIADALMREK